MRAIDLEYGRISSIGLAPVRGSDFAAQFPTGIEVSLAFDPATLDAELIVNGTMYPVGGATDADKSMCD